MIACRLAVVAAAWGAASGAAACTLCNSDVAQTVRAQVLGPDLLGNLAGLATPVPLIAAAVLLVIRLVR